MADSLTIARESYGRCVLKKEFFSDFYEIFLSASPEIKPYFARTDMSKQQQLLREGISFLLLYAQKNEGGRLAVNEVGKMHDRHHIDVRPDLYRIWVDSLLKCIEKNDSRFDSEIKNAWQEVVKPGIERFVELYEARTEDSAGDDG